MCLNYKFLQYLVSPDSDVENYFVTENTQLVSVDCHIAGTINLCPRLIHVILQ